MEACPIYAWLQSITKHILIHYFVCVGLLAPGLQDKDTDRERKSTLEKRKIQLNTASHICLKVSGIIIIIYIRLLNLILDIFIEINLWKDDTWGNRLVQTFFQTLAMSTQAK